MNRSTMVLCTIGALASGFLLYAGKHRTEVLDRRIAGVMQATRAAREQTALLRAEWTLLNSPDRLQDMADRYLQLAPVSPSQFVPLAELKTHLPPAGDAAEGDVAPTPTIAAAATPVRQAPRAPAPEADTEPEFEAGPAAVQPVSKLMAGATVKPPLAHHVTLARSEPPHELTMPSPRPVAARTFNAMARQAPPPAAAIVAAAPYRAPAAFSYGTPPRPPYAAPYVASALGGRPSLPPPVPFGSAP